MRNNFGSNLTDGQWGEKNALDILSKHFFAIQYGPSDAGDKKLSPEEKKERKEKICQIANGRRRPDLLVYAQNHRNKIKKILKDLPRDLSLVPEIWLTPLLEHAICGVEVKTSLRYRSALMPEFDLPLKEMKRLKNCGRMGLRKNAIVPHIFLKPNDLKGLLRWRLENNMPVQVWQFLMDTAWGIDLDRANTIYLDSKNPVLQKKQGHGASSYETINYPYYLGYQVAKKLWEILMPNGDVPGYQDYTKSGKLIWRPMPNVTFALAKKAIKEIKKNKNYEFRKIRVRSNLDAIMGS